MARGFDSRRRVLHKVALPQSWFINLILPGMDMNKDASHFFKFPPIIVDLMQEIDAQVQRYPTATSTTEERFIANGRRVTDLTGPFYIARM